MLRCVFFGTPPVAAHLLKALLQHQACEIAGIVTRLDQPKGRSGRAVPSAVKQLAIEEGLPLWQASRMHLPESLEWLRERNADLFIVIAFGEILRQSVLDIPRLGCINVHMSLLPLYRGAAPMQWALIHGDARTGITLQKMALACDAGDILAQKSLNIESNWTCGDLQENLEKLAEPLLLETLRKLEEGNATAYPQDETKVTWAPKIELDDCRLNFQRSAKDLHQLICGTSPEPGAWCWKLSPGRPCRIRILRTRLSGLYDPTRSPGIAWAEGKRLFVKCADGVLEILEIQLEGKAIQPATSFVNGLQKQTLLLVEQLPEICVES